VVRRVALVVALAACSHPANKTDTVANAGSAAPPPPAAVTDEPAAKAQLGHEVDVRGLAGNAKLGAVVMLTNRTPVYCLGLEEWPDKVNGTQVTAHGKLELSSQFIAPPGGAGTDGPVYVLRACQYKPL
jgi:hypothetical protein